ncbi:MAG: DUF433 domain-containing protein, partial [Chloroflexi bacterium]|nr:DUF433 domain-containing protein [Chloroflexota bacterium]
SLTPAEKVKAIRLLTLELTRTWPGIEKTPGAAGGAACIVRTRIPVWVLENYRLMGWSDARILDNYPTLRAADLVNAWDYADAHSDEIAQGLDANETA